MKRVETVWKEYIWGRENWVFSRPPLFIKLIYAREALSVQVHPDDAYAWQQGYSSGKTEMWYVLDHEPGAFLYYGLKHTVSEKEFRKRIQNGTLLEICRKVPVKKGDVFFIPSGMLHAIGAGICVAEVQQCSNITYRVYDYDREDRNHQKRQLHVEQAADVLGFTPALRGRSPLGQRVWGNGYSGILLEACEYFSVWSYEVEGKAVLDFEELSRERACQGIRYSGERFFSLVVLRGQGKLFGKGEEELWPGDSFSVSVHCRKVEVEGELELLLSCP